MASRALDLFHPAVRAWFAGAFRAPTKPQQLGWPVIARGESTLILAPTGSGKTLTAFLWCLNRLLFAPAPPRAERCRVLYISPLKALAVDIERNLRMPLAGIAASAAAAGTAVTIPEIAIRTGDTPPGERARFLRSPADILITTPESLFLLLTSNARERLRSVDTVIVDEIHALVPTKRGAHLALSLERLEALRESPVQRIGLSATQRPLDEVARFLGGARGRRRGRTRSQTDAATSVHNEFAVDESEADFRPVTIVNASEKKQLRLTVEVPVDERERPHVATVAKDPNVSSRSVWASIHPRLLELIHQHRSTLIFVNSRRLSERLAGALNELAGEPLVRAHHGSLARESRAEVEDLLKAGAIRALVATSSLELGIDMGAIDLVVQIEAPPSVAAGLQRIGRAGHQAGAVSEGIVFPKFRGDLVACAAVARAMHEGTVEATRYPRNPLDVLAQQIVAMTATDKWRVDDLFTAVRGAAPFATLNRRIFDGVLDMLSGRYPSDEFAELRPRVTWDRTRGVVVAREGAKRVAIANAGTIPDRGLYGVFLAGANKPTRVGELDEEMVFETRLGETFTLGASTWRVEEVTHDRVLVSPAPGEPGKMPFWHGDQAGRPIELGYAIGRLVRELRGTPAPAAIDRLVRQHDLDVHAAEVLLKYIQEQAAAAAVPDDRTIVIERSVDEVGDWRVCLLSPLGSRIHAPWAMAVTVLIRRRTGLDVQVMWGDEGFVVRFPGTATAPDPALLLPSSDEVEALVVGQLGSTSLFAARFRETAARALLLPRRRPGQRTPLWQQRKRASDLLAVASRYGSFPALLETYREVLRDHFDMPALVATLRKISTRALAVRTVDSDTPSPFAASLLFSYVANFIYDGDAPLAERRAQALSVDQSQLRELLGDAELRELLDPGAIDALERQLQYLDDDRRIRTADQLHDLLIRIGDLAPAEIQARSAANVEDLLRTLEGDRRIIGLQVAGEHRYIAVEDVARFRDALGATLPAGLPAALLEPVMDPLADLIARYARSHGPFRIRELAERLGLAEVIIDAKLRDTSASGRIIEGEFRPGGTEREWVDANVLRALRRRSLARLRQEIEPVDADALGRFLVSWHGIGSRRLGPEPLLDAIEQLQGAAIPASVLESEVLAARVDQYHPGLLDMVVAAGEVVWIGVDPLGDRDGRVALYLTDRAGELRPPPHIAGETAGAAKRALKGRAAEVLEYLRAHGASFFHAVHEGTGGGFPQETVDALWDLVWRGDITNDTLHPLRAFLRGPDTRSRRPAPPRHGQGFRSRRLVPPTAEGRWSALGAANPVSVTAWTAATTQQLLARHGIVTRETATLEGIAGGFSRIYEVLKAMEDAGRIRRGYFIAGLGAAQFAIPAAVDALRGMRELPETTRAVMLAATDPANPYGASLPWPSVAWASPEGEEGGRPTRSAGARVVLVDGFLTGYLRRNERDLLLFPPESEPRQSQAVRALARALRHAALARDEGRRGMLIETINGAPAIGHAMADLFTSAGFVRAGTGLQIRPVAGIRIAGSTGGGPSMPDAPQDDELVDSPEFEETRDEEQERVRSSNDEDQAMEREGVKSRHNRGYDEAVRGQGQEDVDPDSAESEIDRDDTV